MNDIARTNPLAAAGADIFDLYPATIPTKIGPLRLVSATGDHAPDSQFAVLETVWGLPCDGLVYVDETERRGHHLVAVFHGDTDEDTAIAVCHDWKWGWFRLGAERIGAENASAAISRIVRMCIMRSDNGYAVPPANTIVGALARKGAEVAA